MTARVIHVDFMRRRVCPIDELIAAARIAELRAQDASRLFDAQSDRLMDEMLDLLACVRRALK